MYINLNLMRPGSGGVHGGGGAAHESKALHRVRELLAHPVGYCPPAEPGQALEPGQATYDGHMIGAAVAICIEIDESLH